MSDSIHSKLHHKTPPWVTDGTIFHIRIRVGEGNALPITDPPAAKGLLDSVRLYETKGRWYVHLFLLMPDHLHALLSFDLRHDAMSHVVADWKGFHSRKNGIGWQDNFFDHRIRSREEFDEKAHYIRMNPVRQGLCKAPEEWPFVVDRTTIGT